MPPRSTDPRQLQDPSDRQAIDLHRDPARSTSGSSSGEGSSLSLLHDVAGNQVIGSALAGEDLGGFGPLVATEVTGMVGGLEGAGPMTSNRTMARLMREALSLDLGSASRAMDSSSGRALPEDQQERLGRAFGHDFGHVRIHTDAAAGRAAAALNAHAFALGSDIFFAYGAYQPGSAHGDRLLAHELTHVVQHDTGRLSSAGGAGEVSSPSDPHEREAYANELVVVRRLGEVDAELAAGGPGEEAPVAVDALASGAVEPATGAELSVEAATPATRESAPAGGGSTVQRAEREHGRGEAARELGSRAVALGAAAFLLPGETRAGGDARSGARSLESRLSDLFAPGVRLAPPGSGSEEAGTSLLAEAEQEQLLRLAGFDPHGSSGVDLRELLRPTREAGVADPDADRRQATLRLLAHLAPRLGLHASSIVVHVDADAAARTRAASTIGLVSGGAVYLDPEAYRPETRAGQHLLAHELAHVAQGRLPDDGLATPLHAEADAELFADAFVSGRPAEGGQVPLPSGYEARYTGPAGADLSALTETYKEAAQAKADAAKMKASAADGNAPDEGPGKPREKERDEVEDFEDGIESTVDELEDTDAFEDLEDAYDDGETTSGPMNRVKRSEYYTNAVDMWKGAKKNENHAARMQSIFDSEFDRTGIIAGDEYPRALRRVRDEAKADAEAQLAAEAALAELEAARAHEEAAKSKVKDLGGPEPGKDGGKGADAKQGAGVDPGSIVAVPQFPPDAPNFAKAEARQHGDSWAAAEKEFSHHETYQAQMAAGANRGWDRTSQVAAEFGKGFVAGFASGLTNGLRDKFLTDLVGGGLDRMLQASPRFGGAMRGVPFGKNLIKAWQSGLLTGDFDQVWSGWTGKYDEAGAAIDGMGSVIGAWSRYDSFEDRVGLVIKFAADLFQMFASIFGLITDILGTIETICWVLGGLFIILGIAFSWCGFGFLLPWGLQVIRVARILKRINDVLQPIADALAVIASILRVISALTVPAEFYGQELAATGAAGEFFGDKAGGQVADNLADEAKTRASKPITEKPGGTDNPVQKAQQEGAAEGEALAAASGARGDENAERLREADEEATRTLQDEQEQNKRLEAEEAEAAKAKPADEAPPAADQEAAPKKATTPDEASPSPGKRALSFLRKATGWDGIAKLNPVAQFRDARTNLTLAATQIESLWNSKAWDEAADRQNDQLLQEAAGALLKVGEVTADNEQAQDLLMRLAVAERQMARMQADDASPEAVDALKAEIKQIRDNSDLARSVQAYDGIVRDLKRMEGRFAKIRDAQREDVQSDLLRSLQDEREKDPAHFTNASMFGRKNNAADQRLREQREARDAHTRPSEIQAEIETSTSQRDRALQGATEAEQLAQKHQDLAERLQEVESLQSRQRSLRDDAEDANRLADSVENLHSLDAQATAKERAAAEARTRHEQGLDTVRAQAGTAVQVAEGEGGPIQEVRPEGVVVGEGETQRLVPWNQIEGPDEIREAASQVQASGAQHEQLAQEAEGLRQQHRETQMSFAYDHVMAAAMQSDPAELRSQAAASSHEAAALEEQIQGAREALPAEDGGLTTAAQHRDAAANANRSRDQLLQAAREADARRATLATALEESKAAHQNPAQSSVDAGVGAHDYQTSAKGGPGAPKKKEATRGSGIFKMYLDRLVQGGDSTWFKVYKNLSSTGWLALVGHKPEKEKEKKKSDAEKVAAAEKALTAPKKEESTFKQVNAYVLDPGGQVKGMIDGAFASAGMPRAYKELVEVKPPEVNTEDLQKVYDEASNEMELNSIYHSQAYNAYLMELAAASKSIEARELAEKVGTMAVKRAQDQEGPLKEAQAKEEQRGQKLAGVDPDVKPADSAMGSLLQTIMEAIMEGGDEVDDAPSNVKDTDPSKSQDETAKASKETQKGNEDASKAQGAYLKDLGVKQKTIQTSIQDDRQAVLDKADRDQNIMLEIRGMKEHNLQQAAMHHQAGETKATEFNAGLDTLVVWAADYKARREKVGLSLEG